MAETRAERFTRLLKLALPERAEHIDSGKWGPTGCPYHFLTLRDGSQRLVIEKHDLRPAVDKSLDDDPQPIERFSLTGKTRDDLLDRLEARLTSQPGQGQ